MLLLGLVLLCWLRVRSLWGEGGLLDDRPCRDYSLLLLSCHLGVLLLRLRLRLDP
jgi:hypothetical protein